MINSEYTRICKLSDLREKVGQRFLIDDTDIAIFKVNGKVYALSNVCPHKLSALIYDGFIEDDCVVCPAHGWKFNLKDGKKPTGSHGLVSFPVEIVDDEVYVLVKRKELNW